VKASLWPSGETAKDSNGVFSGGNMEPQHTGSPGRILRPSFHELRYGAPLWQQDQNRIRAALRLVISTEPVQQASCLHSNDSRLSNPMTRSAQWLDGDNGFLDLGLAALDHIPQETTGTLRISKSRAGQNPLELQTYSLGVYVGHLIMLWLSRDDLQSTRVAENPY